MEPHLRYLTIVAIYEMNAVCDARYVQALPNPRAIPAANEIIKMCNSLSFAPFLSPMRFEYHLLVASRFFLSKCSA